MTNISFNPPKLSGPVLIGIAEINTYSLSNDWKLPILTSGDALATMRMIRSNAAIWAFNKFTDIDARMLFVNGCIICIDLGLLQSIGEIPDGDWHKTATPEADNNALAGDILRIISVDEMKKALTVIVAAKVNFWSLGHHIGQETITGYVKEVLKTYYGDRVSKQLILAAHNIGRFASTLYILKIAGLTGLRSTTMLIKQDESSLSISTDIKLRFQSMPAGTKKLAIAYEAAKRLVRSRYALYCPNIDDFVILPELKRQVMETPASYHINASYLTGADRTAYANSNIDRMLGRLGTFALIIHKHSTFAKSPHFQWARVESYDDYDPVFKLTLIRLLQQPIAKGRLVKEFEVFNVASEDEVITLRNSFT